MKDKFSSEGTKRKVADDVLEDMTDLCIECGPGKGVKVVVPYGSRLERRRVCGFVKGMRMRLQHFLGKPHMSPPEAKLPFKNTSRSERPKRTAFVQTMPIHLHSIERIS